MFGQDKSQDYISYQREVMRDILEEKSNKVPIRRGCNANGGCFCSGKCQEIIGWRDKHPLEQSSPFDFGNTNEQH